jgi:hypothetical protein
LRHSNIAVTIKNVHMANVLENRISITFSDAELRQLTTARNTYLNALRAKTVALTSGELGNLGSMEVSNFVFVKDTLTATDEEGRALVAGAFAALVPELAKDVALFEQLDAEEMQLTGLLTRIQHTRRLAAHESYKVATQLYGQYQSLAEAGVPGAVTRYNMLKERFKDNGGGRPKDEPLTPAV